jgi:3-deoxy-D-manno-octulosonate 8-phosphate phosphatase (KDO 8-P phosphatase)
VQALAKIRAFALDVDGVLTDDGFYWGPNGQEWKRFSFADVMGISRASKLGLTFALVSGEASPLVDRYAEKMRIGDVFKGCKDKLAAVKAFADRHALTADQVGMMGNDVNDLAALEWCGFSAAPKDAHPSVRAKVSLVVERSAGFGAVREVLDLWMATRPS